MTVHRFKKKLGVVFFESGYLHLVI